MKRIAVSILVYNEEDTLPPTLDNGYKILKTLFDDFDFWIFDNCSSDNSENLIKEFSAGKNEIKYFRHEKNIGYGLNSFSAITIPKADYIFVIDGDGQYDFQDIPKVLDKLKNGYDVIFGWRRLRKDSMLRKITTFFFNILAKIILKSKIKDINSGFKAFSQKSASQLITDYKYNYIGPEIYIQSVYKNFKVGECEINHYERNGGTSYFNGFKSIFINTFIMINYLFELRHKYIFKK